MFWKIQYACSAWNPHNKCEIDQLELVQYRTDRLATNRQRNTSSAGDMLQHLNWRIPKDRRIDARLVMMYKIENQNIHLVQKKTALSHHSDNHRTCISCLSLSLIVRLDKDKTRCFPRTIFDWNWLSQPYSFESLGWNIPSCCLLYQVLIYKKFN